MIITKDQKIGAQKAIKVRDALRRTAEYFDTDELAEKLNLSKKAAKFVIDDLLNEGYINVHEDETKRKTYWSVTLRGIHLVNASVNN